MEPDKEKIIQLIQDLLEDPKLKGLTHEERSVLVFDDVVNPLFKELEAHYAILAYKYGNYSPGRSN